MKKEKSENVEKQEKIKIDKKKIFSKTMALILLVAMVLASCSTCIYFVVSNIA